MLAEDSVRLKPGIPWVIAALLLVLTSPPVLAQETVYIGGRSAGPAVEVDLSALNGQYPRRIARPGPPDILPPDPANAPRARATSSVRLAPPPHTYASRPPVATRPPAAAAIASSSAPVTGAPGNITPTPLNPGLTPSPAPARPVTKSPLTAAAPPKPITPVTAGAGRVAPPPPAASPPQAMVALPAGLSPSVSSAPAAAAAAIMFAPGAIELTPEATAQLDALMASLGGQDRVQLKAHASGAQNDAETRRIALKRALAARSHLLASGMESARIDVRALGPAGDGGADDRIDVIVVTQ